MTAFSQACKRLHSSSIQSFAIWIAPIGRSNDNHEHRDRFKALLQRFFEWNLSDILQKRRTLPDWILNVQQHERGPMPQTQSLQLSSKATVQQAGVILGQVCVLEGLENLVEKPARNTRNAKASWSRWQVYIQKLLWGRREKERNLYHYHCGLFTSEANKSAHIDHVTVVQRLDVHRINSCPVERCHNNLVSSPRDNSTLWTTETKCRKKKRLK